MVHLYKTLTMSTTSVPTNLLAPAAVFASLTFMFEVVIIICIIITASTVQSTPPPFYPPSPSPPFTPPALRRYLKDGENNISTQASTGMLVSIFISLVLAFLTCCMVFAIHAQRAK